MDAKRILVAVEMRSYRESIAEALREFCPGAEVYEAKPENIELAAERLRFDLIVCTHASDVVRANASNWIELYPDPLSQKSEASIGGRLLELAGVQLADLFSMVDQIRRPVQPN